MGVDGRIKGKLGEEVGKRREKRTSAFPGKMTVALLHLHLRSQETEPEPNTWVKRSKKSVTESHPSMSIYSMVMDSINSRFIPSTKRKKKKKESICIQYVQTYYYSLSNRVNLLTLHCIEYHKPSRDGVTHVYRRTLPKFHGNGLAVYIKETPGES